MKLPLEPRLEALAQASVRAWEDGEKGKGCIRFALPPVASAPTSRAEAFAVQDRFAEILGEPCIGWKVGAAVPAVQIMEGHDGPIVGRLFAHRQYTSPAQLSAGQFDDFKIECEFAFRFKRGLPSQATRGKAYTREELAPLLVLHCGLEVAGHRYVQNASSRKITTYDLIADNGACGAYIEGAAIPDWQHIDFAAVSIDARIHTEKGAGEPIQTFSGEFFRDPVDVLVEVVNGLLERGIGMQTGDLLTTGSITSPTTMRAGQTFVANFINLGKISLQYV
jgi:2-keto-4-pentenoate hydratase